MDNPTRLYKGAHFAAFPLKLVIPCVLAGSRERDTILDPFFGSGTVAEAVALLNRNWLGIELNSSYQNLYKERLALFA
jgi:modification methylase smaI